MEGCRGAGGILEGIVKESGGKGDSVGVNSWLKVMNLSS